MFPVALTERMAPPGWFGNDKELAIPDHLIKQIKHALKL